MQTIDYNIEDKITNYLRLTFDKIVEKFTEDEAQQKVLSSHSKEKFYKDAIKKFGNFETIIENNVTYYYCINEKQIKDIIDKHYIDIFDDIVMAKRRRIEKELKEQEEESQIQQRKLEAQRAARKFEMLNKFATIALWVILGIIILPIWFILACCGSTGKKK